LTPEIQEYILRTYKSNFQWNKIIIYRVAWGRKGGEQMERNRSNGILLVVAGAALALISAFAYELGLGDKAYGWLQGLGTFLGSIIILAGVYLTNFEGKYLTATGIAMVVLFLAWDKLGMGEPGFGCAHSIALFTGVGIACIGIYFIRKGS
jgi:hypothetical protein